jgi:saccharopine dehydrogenase-like NADP-dependent oxidoreductase
MPPAAPCATTPNRMPDPALRVLVVGGAGVFGWRLVQGLLAYTTFDVIIAGRDEGRLTAAAQRCDALSIRPARVRTLVLDARQATADCLRATGAFAAVDAAGPFQGSDYRLARAVIAAGIHYLDLADARDFVAGFAILDTVAKQTGVVALTGVSTTPALSTAVLERLTAGWRSVERVEIAISPGNRAPRGLSVVRSILSYAGRPVRVFIDGQWSMRPGWGLTVRRVMPGLGPRWLSLTETPDLDTVPARFGVRSSALFRAGLEMSLLHLGLLAASLPVRIGLVRSIARLARPFRWMAALLDRFGTDRGGMIVEATGLDGQDEPVTATWSLVAESGDGPFVPTLPALAVLRALADGRIARPGASICLGMLPLEAIEAEFRPHRIRSSTWLERSPGHT